MTFRVPADSAKDILSEIKQRYDFHQSTFKTFAESHSIALTVYSKTAGFVAKHVKRKQPAARLSTA